MGIESKNSPPSENGRRAQISKITAALEMGYELVCETTPAGKLAFFVGDIRICEEVVRRFIREGVLHPREDGLFSGFSQTYDYNSPPTGQEGGR